MCKIRVIGQFPYIWSTFFYLLINIWRVRKKGRERREGRESPDPSAYRYRAVLRSGLTNRSLRDQIGRLDWYTSNETACTRQRAEEYRERRGEGGESLSYIAAVNSEDAGERRTMIGAYIRGGSRAEIGSVFAFLTEVHCQLHLYVDARRNWKVNCQKHPEKNRQSIERTRKRIDVTGRANVECDGSKNTKG